jgi:glycosyltransferase involved in cell wall biosynthesis
VTDALRSPRVAPREIVFESGDLGAADASVCITLHDYGAYIVGALESAYAQTLERLGLVVLDDCSSDDGPARAERWLRRFGDRFAGVCLARHPRNAGLARARNGSVDLARSAFVMILDADNELHPRCVERLVASLRDAEHGFAYPIIERFGVRRGLMGTSSWNVEMLRDENYVDAMALLRKETWRRVGGYDRMRVGGWEDFDFWCKCVEAGIHGLLVPEILARYRDHPSSMLARETNRKANARRVRSEMLERHPWLRLGLAHADDPDESAPPTLPSPR